MLNGTCRKADDGDGSAGRKKTKKKKKRRKAEEELDGLCAKGLER